MEKIIQLIVLVFSAVVHEVMHGVVAEKFGDDTARREGRITLNPIPHLDIFSSILLPLFLYYAGSPVILGAAKPVPVDFSNMRRPRLGMAVVSLAGPLSNFALAILAAVTIKSGLATEFASMVLAQVVIVNIVLGVFNLLPIPPLDGSKVIASLGNRAWMQTILSFEQYGFLLVILFLMFGWLDKIILPVLSGFVKIFGLD